MFTTTTERANNVIENVMRRLKACNAKDPKLIKCRITNKDAYTAVSAAISVSAVGTTNPKYREDVVDIIKMAVARYDVFGSTVRFRSETDGVVTIDVIYNVGRNIDVQEFPQPDHAPKKYSNDRVFSSESDDVIAILKNIGIISTIKTASNTNNARTGTHMTSCVIKFILPDTFSKTMIRHIPKIVRDEMMVKYSNKHTNANILELEGNNYLYVTIVTKIR
jgi:hypothetical protein